MHTKAKNRLITIWLMLSLALLCALSVTLIYADNQASQDVGVGITYTSKIKGLKFEENSDNGYSISASSTSIEGALEIPESYKGKPITAIKSYGFRNCTKLTSVVIPDSVTIIYNDAFLNCLYLKKVVIGNGVKTIGESAFSNCVSLSDVTLGTGVTTIMTGAFNSCSGGAEDGMHGLMSITIPENVTTIYPNVFYMCLELTSVKFEYYGWQVADSLEEDRGDDILDVSELKKTQTAAQYLTSSSYYLNKYWFKW